MRTAVTSLVKTAKYELASRLTGRLITREDPDYDQVRAVYNAMHDRRPALVVACSDANDVAAAVRFAAEHQLDLAVRGGGHSVAGFSTCDDGIVIDLRPMKEIRVDTHRLTARAQAGCTWGEFDAATHVHGSATTGGLVSTTGIAGLTLGGGFGHLTRRRGLSCDSLVRAEVVTPSGEILAAEEERNEDLLWALRGGGGNFGVVTEFEFALDHVAQVYGGPIVYQMEAAPDVLRAHADLVADGPDEFGGICALGQIPPFPFISDDCHGRPGCIVIVCWSGLEKDAADVLRPLREIEPKLGEMLSVRPYPVMNTLFDELLPPGLRHYWKASFVEDLPGGAIDVHLERAPHSPTLESGTFFFPLRGAAARVSADATAFGHRDALYNVLVAGTWHGAANDQKNIAWVRDYHQALRPFSGPGGYVNFQATEETDRIPDNYGVHYDKLAAIKTRYDPSNLFKLNQNIAPRA